MGDVRLATQALETDQALWAQAATRLGDAGRDANAIVISDGDWPVRGTLEVAYKNLQEKVVDLLLGGEKQCNALGDELINIRNILTGSDEGAKDRIRGLWDY